MIESINEGEEINLLCRISNSVCGASTLEEMLLNHGGLLLGAPPPRTGRKRGEAQADGGEPRQTPLCPGEHFRVDNPKSSDSLSPRGCLWPSLLNP